jgi:NADH-quinone oxidoreductase subunit M
MKKLIAYSSVAHMGYVSIGAFTMTKQGIEGAIYQMLSHGIVSAALFLIVGVVYDRMHSRDIATYGGLVHRMPMYALVFMVFMLASVGLPSTSGFVGEYLVLVGAFMTNAWVAAMAALSLILGAAYMLYLYRRVIFGTLTKDSLRNITDLAPREIATFAPLMVLVFWMGIYPKSFLDVMHVSVDNLVKRVEIATASPERVPTSLADAGR